MDDLSTLDLGDVDWAFDLLATEPFTAYCDWNDDGGPPTGDDLLNDSPLLSEDCSVLLNEISRDLEIDKDLAFEFPPQSPIRSGGAASSSSGAAGSSGSGWPIADDGFSWDLGSAGHSSLSSPSGLDDFFSTNSTGHSFASSPSMSESDFQFGDPFIDGFLNQAATSTQSLHNSMLPPQQPQQADPLVRKTGNSIKLETSPATANVSTRPRRRPPVSTRTALVTPKHGKPPGQPPRRRGRPEKDPRRTNGLQNTTNNAHQNGGMMVQQLPQQGALEPALLSRYFMQNSESASRQPSSTSSSSSSPSFPSKEAPARHQENQGPMLATQEMMQHISACQCDDQGPRARAMAARKGQMLRTSPSSSSSSSASSSPQCHIHPKLENGQPNGSSSSASSASPSTNPFLKKPILMRKRLRECTMVCWLFRTLLTAEYRALPLNGIFEVFEETFTNPTTAHGRHWRQSIRHCLMSSAVFVRVLTPNPRKDFLVMNEAGSWWTVHPDTEALCAREVFALGAGHRCPPQQGVPYRLRFGRTDDRQQFERRGTAFLGERIYRTPPPLAQRRISQHTQHQRQYMAQFRNFSNLQAMRQQKAQQQQQQQQHQQAPPPSQATPTQGPAPFDGDQLVVDHEEEVFC